MAHAQLTGEDGGLREQAEGRSGGLLQDSIVPHRGSSCKVGRGETGSFRCRSAGGGPSRLRRSKGDEKG
jgi:hypothetical protein